MNPRNLAVRAAALFAAVLLLSNPATAQMTRGAVSGTVRDQTAGAIPGVTVTATNSDTAATRSALSDAIGFYRLPALEPGTYTVRAELSGFTSFSTTVKINADTEVKIDVGLKVASLGESVTVEGSVSSIELNRTSPTVGTTSTARQVVELPLSADRNVNNLIATSPNVNRVSGQGTFAANGQRSRNNNYMIDGSDNNDISVTIATTQVDPESVAEFQVQTNAYSVEFGRNSGSERSSSSIVS